MIATNQSPVESRSTFKTAPRSFARIDWAAAGLLALLNLLVFHRSLSGYFLADDFIHVAYLSEVFSGHPEKLLANFTGNWMQAQGTQFYRPFISLTLAFDYLAGGGKAFVFHLSNVLYQIGCTIALYFIGARLLREYGERSARQAGMVAACAFAVCPLHPEVVSWIIGRVDSVCLFFYLISFWMYLGYRQDGGKGRLAAALGAFALSLLSKEMAVTLPPVLVLAEIFLSSGTSRGWSTLTVALRQTSVFWMLLALYLGVRTAALGTIAGGYSGSIGEGLSQSLLSRWFGDQSLLRVLYPFNAEVFSPQDKLRKALSICYAAAAAALAARLALMGAGAGISRYAGFAALWFVVSMLPTYQVWNLTETLQCSRFIYAGTAPLSLLLALLIVPIWTASAGSPGRRRQLFGRLAVVLASALILVLAAICYRNNLPWAHAGAQVRAFRSAVESAAAELAGGENLAVLNIPQRLQGAHMLYNAAMLSVLMSPPLSPPGLAARITSFEPITYGDGELINVTRLRELIAAGHDRFFYWNALTRSRKERRGRRGPAEVTFPCPVQAVRRQGCHTIRFVSPELKLPAAVTDFIECRLVLDAAPAGEGSLPPGRNSGESPSHVFLFWSGKDDAAFVPAQSLALPALADGKEHLYRFPVSERKSWIAQSEVSRLCIEVPFAQAARLVSVAGRSMGEVCPSLRSVDLRTGNDGVAQFDRPQARFAVDALTVKGATGTVVELSGGDAWFEHYTGTLRDSGLSKHAVRRISLPPRAELTLRREDFGGPAFYQIRALPVDANGAVIGCSSDPINLQISR